MVVNIKVDCSAKRADLFLSQTLGLTRNRVQHLIEQGFLLLNNNPFKPSSRLKIGDMVSGNIPEETDDEELKPIYLPLDIIYEDESLIIINKPKGIVVHPSFGHKKDTIVNAILHHCKEVLNIAGSKRPGVVHRLDKDTSGLLLFAKNDQALNELQKQFKNREVIKKYLALLLGKPDKNEDIIITNIGRHPKDRKKFAVTKEGRQAITEYKILKSFSGVSLAEITIKTGRTHQIRVHMSYINTPIIGDKDYNKKNYENIIKDANLLKLCKDMKGQALCAYFLSFRHPITGKIMEFKINPSSDMKEIINWIEKYGTDKKT